MHQATQERALGHAPAKLLTIRRVLAVCALLLVGGTLPSAQTPSRPATPATPADQAERALNLGRFDEVERLIGNATDPRSLAIRARSLIVRGRYPEAEKLLAAPASSQPGSDAALELGRLQLYLGKRTEGDRTLSRLLDSVEPRTAADYLRLALAARELGASRSETQLFHDANDYFGSANRLAPDDTTINTAWGEIWLEKYDPAEAMKKFQDALRVDENDVGALVGLARIAVTTNPPAARSAVERALKANPSSVPAHLLAAEMALDDRRRDDARESLERALKVNPNSLEARALQGAIAFLEGRTADFEREAQEVLKINPSYGEAYRVPADHAARNYRFDEAVVLVKRAIGVDANDPRAYADLGSHLMRTGDEPGARVALERAFKADPFNQLTYNQLELLDTLDKFETITDGDIVMRLHPDEVAVMREHALPLAKEALETLSKLYQFKPTGPILVEMFPKHDDFAVRTIGLPGFIGALGACFGRVVTLDSPKARKPGEFNWQETLWHEMAHVITLQMSGNRLPRWLSEGASVWEERRARPEWGHESELMFAQALNDGKTFKLDEINEGFSDPQRISLAYYQASLIVEHLVETHGEPKFHQLLRAYGRGLETDAALKEVYGVTIGQLQTSFDAKVDKQFAGMQTALKHPDTEEKTPSVDTLKALVASNPKSFAAQVQLGLALEEAGDHAGAIQALERAAELLPNAGGDNNPNKIIAAIALKQQDNARAIRALEAVVRADPSDVESARRLASLVAPLGDAARTEDAYRRVVGIDPFDAASQTAYGRLVLQRNDAQAAVRAFRSALATNPPDRAAAHLDLAEAYLKSGQLADAKRQTLAALEIAPSFERAQDLLLKIVDAGGGGV